MYHPELADLQIRHQLSPAVMDEFQSILLRASSGQTHVLGPSNEVAPTLALLPEQEEPALEPSPGHRTLSWERYEDRGVLGRGGMAEVRRVRDPALGRTMAMKIVRTELQKNQRVLERFVEEAQCSAQLQHPGIVPVHELGRLPDGRLYFTMAEVRGRTLGEVISEVHRASAWDTWEPGTSGWTFRRVVAAFHRVCEEG
jgi:serine/threonine-protein kinase